MSRIIHLPDKKTYNNNIELIEIHILFNVNDKSVDNITELNKIKEYLQKNNIVSPIHYKQINKVIEKLDFYINTFQSKAIFMFCEYCRTYLMFLDQHQTYTVCFTEKIQKMTNINKPFMIKNQDAGGLKTT